MSEIVKPKVLKPGDTIGVIAPSSPTFEPGYLESTLAWLGKLGLKYKLGKNTFRSYSSYAGSDEARLADLHEAFADQAVSAVLPLRGGAGASRLLLKLDYGLLAANPKIICGFSDITALLLAVHQKTGLVTFHGPTLNLMYESAYTHAYWQKALMKTQPIGLITEPEENDKEQGDVWGASYPSRMVINPGRASGRLTGGCLTLIRGLMGTPFEIDTKDRLVFIEDVDEEPHAMDRMLTQLVLAGKFKEARGIIIGDCSGCRPGGSKRNSLTLNHALEEVLRERLSKLDIPVVYGFKIGHTADKITLPIGVEASLYASDQAGLPYLNRYKSGQSAVRLKIEEGALCDKATPSKK